MNQPKLVEKIEFTLEYSDIYFFNYCFFKKFGALKYRFSGLIFLGGITLVMLVIWALTDRLISQIFLKAFFLFLFLFLGFLLASVVVLPMSNTQNSKKMFYGCPDNSSPMVAEFFYDALRVSKKYSRSTYFWKDIFCCVEGTSCFCFYFDGEDPNGEILPKSFLTQQQSEELSEFLKKKIGDKYFAD